MLIEDDDEDEETENGDEVTEDNDEDGPAVDLLELLGGGAGDATGNGDAPQEANARPREIRGMCKYRFRGVSLVTTNSVTHAELIRLIQQTGAGGLERLLGAIQNADDDNIGFPGFRVRTRRDPFVSEFPEVPSSYGRQLMESGVFGTHERHANRIRKKKKLAARIMRRELGLESPGGQRSSTNLARQVVNHLKWFEYELTSRRA